VHNLQGGIKLSLRVGPVPIPAPSALVEALSSVSVQAGSGDTQSGFEMTFDLPARSPLRTLFLLTGGGSLPLMRVVLVVQIGGQAESIIDGVTTNVETQPGEGGVGKLVVKGKDLSALMDIIEIPGLPFPAMPPAVRVLVILAKYAAFGVIPLVIPSIVEDVPIPVDRIPQQRGSDYAYVSELARQCGYVFYLEPGPAPATSKAYWGPEIRVGEPQPALSVNMDALSNVDELSFNFDKEKKTMPIVYFQELLSNDGRPGVRGAAQRFGVRPGPARRRALRPPAEVAPAGRRSRRGPAVRRPVLREERQPRHQARRIQAELHARAQRADLDRSDGARMSASARPLRRKRFSRSAGSAEGRRVHQ